MPSASPGAAVVPRAPPTTTEENPAMSTAREELVELTRSVAGAVGRTGVRQKRMRVFRTAARGGGRAGAQSPLRGPPDVVHRGGRRAAVHLAEPRSRSARSPGRGPGRSHARWGLGLAAGFAAVQFRAVPRDPRRDRHAHGGLPKADPTRSRAHPHRPSGRGPPHTRPARRARWRSRHVACSCAGNSGDETGWPLPPRSGGESAEAAHGELGG